MNDQFYSQLKRQIKRHEGEVKRAGWHVPYQDSRGIVTIGHGHNMEVGDIIEVHPHSGGITDSEADALLDRDLHTSMVSVLVRYPWAEQLKPAMLGVLVDMHYNLGARGLAGFKRFLRNAEAGRYSDAAVEMIDSRWARQVPYRAIVLVKIWLSGEWHYG